MRVVFFEDENARRLAPIALTRPVFELLCGCFSARERAIAELKPQTWGALVRAELRDVTREQHPTAMVNDPISLRDGSTLLINGRWLFDANSISLASADNVGLVGDQIAWLKIDAIEAQLLDEDNWNEVIPQIAHSRAAKVDASGTMISYPWDLIAANPSQLAADIRNHFEPAATAAEHVAVLGDPANVSIDPTAEIDPYVVLDARTGPIRVSAGARIQSFTRIEGPCFIGQDTQLFRALVREGCSIGPTCRVGGEIEESIIHGYANKYHEGFLGHSYVCPWVNIGAMSTTSDLKNDYSSIAVPLEGTPVDSGSHKVGSFIGDHAKVAINSMFNTGSSVGVMAMVLPGGPLLPRFVPSFSMVWFGTLKDAWPLDRSIESARTAMSRRGQELSEAQEALLRLLHQQTASQRAETVKHAAIRAAARERRERR